MSQLMNADKFKRVKRAFETTNSIAAVSRRFKIGWDTARQVKLADSFENYRPHNHHIPVNDEHPVIAQLKREQHQMNEQFDKAIAQLEKLYSR